MAGLRAVRTAEMNRPPKKITDVQIHKLYTAGRIANNTYHGALLVLAHHGSLGRQVRRKSRERCAEILNKKGTK